VVEAEGRSIGLIHGWGSPDGLPERVLESFDPSVEVIVFGHSHRSYCQRNGKVLLFNPGSATDRRFAPYRSVGILHLENKISGEIIKLE
jgi:putative phosphoesterase